MISMDTGIACLYDGNRWVNPRSFSLLKLSILYMSVFRGGIAWKEAYLEPSQASNMELFFENS